MTPPNGASRTQGELDGETFRAAAGRALEWLAEYLAHPEIYPVLARTAPNAIRAELPPHAPATGESFEHILDDFERLIVPGITHSNHPGFLAYFANTGSVPGVIADFLAAGLNINAMMWRTSPAATELETTVVGWLRDALGLPPGWFGMINDTASMSTLLALAAARDVAVPDVRERGLRGSAVLRLYVSEHAHSSVDKAAVLLGIGLENIVRIATDDEFRMNPAALEACVAADRAAGLQPWAVVATVGTTSTTSIDPVAKIATITTRDGLWLHVDAAYGGAAAIAPEFRFVNDGATGADSWVVNPHKWLFTPIDASLLYTRRPDDLRRAFSLVPEYLKSNDGDVVNFMDYGIQLGRRFRSLKLWFVLRAYGTDGIADRIREHVRLARELAQRVDAHPDLELMAPTPLSVVCLRVRPRQYQHRETESEVGAELDRLNQSVMDRVNADGESFLSHTRLGGRLVLRVAIGNIRTNEAHVRRLQQSLLEAAGLSAT